MADAPQDCIAQRDDYLECLHHTKEVRNLSLAMDWSWGKEKGNAEKWNKQQ